MTKTLMTVCVLGVLVIAPAATPSNLPGLPPTELVRPLLERDPSVAAAGAGLDVGRNEAGMLGQSPYEWTSRATGQVRTLRSGPDYGEWNIGIERTVRLPAKAAADRSIGSAVVTAAHARYREALHESARAFLSLWLDWLAAEQALELAVKGLDAVQESLAAVEKRVRAGDASKLDLSVARAEIATQQRLHNDTRTEAAAAWARLSIRFPGMPRQVTPLPVPGLLEEDVSYWRERILAESDELKIVDAQRSKGRAMAERARAEKIPDPTLGVYTASETGGREHITGITLSIPIPGGVRNSRIAIAAAEAEVSAQEVELTRRRIAAEIESTYVMAHGALESLRIATEADKAMQNNAALTLRAYELGEADLQSMLLARRQAFETMTGVLEAQLTALKTNCSLFLDAHLIWDLASD